MWLKLNSLLRHRKRILWTLLLSCLTTVLIMNLLIPRKFAVQTTDNAEEPWQQALFREESSDHATGGIHQLTGNAGNTGSTGSRSVRILCWIMTDPDDLDVRVIHVKNTWASRCDVTLFFSSQTNKTFPTIGLNVSSGRNNIAVKSRESWTHVFQHYYDAADYFMKADPDTYVLVDNLRQYLSNCDSSDPEVFGHRLQLRNTTYFSGAAIVLSREALRRLVTEGYAKYKHYIDAGKAEDLKNARCLHEVGVRFVDTRDLDGRETFLPLVLNHHLFPSSKYIPDWYQRYRGNETKTGRECCSNRPVAFHYVQPLEMYSFDYLLHITDGSSHDTEAGEGHHRHHQPQQQQNQGPPQSNRRILMFLGTKNKKPDELE